MPNTIIIKRGAYTSIPNLQDGEIGYCVDKNAIFIGSNAGNQLISAIMTGVHTSRPVSPIIGQIYISTDIPAISICYASGTWMEYIECVMTEATFINRKYNMSVYDLLLKVAADANANTIFMPLCSLAEGHIYTVICTETGEAITISPHKDDTGALIGGAISYEISNKYDKVSLLSDGAEWYII